MELTVTLNGNVLKQRILSTHKINIKINLITLELRNFSSLFVMFADESPFRNFWTTGVSRLSRHIDKIHFQFFKLYKKILFFFPVFMQKLFRLKENCVCLNTGTSVIK